MSYLTPQAEQQGLSTSFKGVVRVASTANVNLAGTLTALDTISLNDEDRVLLKNQSTASENGVYEWSSGTQMLTRSRDFLTGTVVGGCLVAVSEGSTHSNTLWQLATPSPITVGSTALSFTEAGGTGGESLGSTLLIGNTTSGTDISVSPGDSITAPDGDNLNIQTLNATGISGDLLLSSGDGGAAANSGDVLISSGDGGAGGGAAGRITLQGGSGDGGGGGSVDILGGVAGTVGGGVFIKSGPTAQLRIETQATSSVVGNLNIIGGTSSSGVGNPGGDINVTAGDCTGAGSGGDVNISSGDGAGGGLGGSLTLTTGNGSNAVAGGTLTLQGGTGGGSDGAGALVDIRAGDGGVTNGNGGDIELRPGNAAGTGVDGEVVSIRNHRFITQATFPSAGIATTGVGEGALSGNLSGDLDWRRPSNGNIVTVTWSDPIFVPLAPFSTVDGLTADTIIGWVALDMNNWGRRFTWTFEAILQINDVARTGTVYIQDITNNQLISTLSVTGSTDITKVNAVLTTGGGANELKYADTLYEIHLTMDGGSGSDTTILGNAYLRMTE